MMSDDPPFLPPPVPLLSVAEARKLAREYQAMADRLREMGDTGTARILEQRGAWWLAYAGRSDDQTKALTASLDQMAEILFALADKFGVDYRR
jgi:hypothetical protein